MAFLEIGSKLCFLYWLLLLGYLGISFRTDTVLLYILIISLCRSSQPSFPSSYLYTPSSLRNSRSCDTQLDSSKSSNCWTTFRNSRSPLKDLMISNWESVFGFLPFANIGVAESRLEFSGGKFLQSHILFWLSKIGIFFPYKESVSFGSDSRGDQSDFKSLGPQK